jgi:hypothetical protein
MKRNRFHIPALCLSAVALAVTVGYILAAPTTAAKPASTIHLATPKAPPMFERYCFPCHGVSSPMAGISIEKLATSQIPLAEGYPQWTRIATALEQHVMPPEGMPQPDEKDRAAAASWIHSQLDTYAKKHDGDPGRVTVRRLTSGEYAYAIQDLTGYTFDTGIDASSDSVGGEGFTNFGDVQFMQDVNLEHYLDAAKLVANHAVIGAGPLAFYSEPGKPGYEFSGITRVKDIYLKYGFRTVSGEGGYAYGLEQYGKVFYVTWEYEYRAALGEPAATIKSIADREGVEPRFAQHVYEVMNRPVLSYPLSDMAAHWHKLSAPTSDIKASEALARTQCTELQNFETSWAGWFFGRGDAAFGGAGDESPLIFNDTSLKADPAHHFTFAHRAIAGRGASGGTGPTKIYLNVANVNPAAKGQGAIIWKSATIAFTNNAFGRGGAAGASGGIAAVGAAGASGGAGRGRGRGPAVPRVSLRSVVNAATTKQLNFGKAIDGSTLGPDDFSTDGSVSFEVPMPAGITSFDIQLDATLGANRDHVYRVTIADREDPRGIPTRGLVGDPKSPGYQTFKAGVLEYANTLPPNSNDQPTPADKDPPPEPFDPTYNTPEHDDYVIQVKYIRGDRFVWNHLLNDENRKRVDDAWNDIYASFPYHDNYLRLLAQHFNYDLKGKKMADMNPAAMAALPDAMRQYAAPLRKTWEEMTAAQAAAKPRHIEDVIAFASRAWRRPLTEAEKLSLRAFYAKSLAADPDHDHVAAIRAVIARVLVAPQFLYKIETASQTGSAQRALSNNAARPLNSYEMASRLSFFLWSSIPDDELRRAASTGELITNTGLQKQVKRMLADPKARRLSTEFFGQWLGFYHFDQFKGVDTGRYPEFTDEVKSSMYDQAVSFFEHIVRANRPVSDILYADYDFLNAPLAKYYGIKQEVKATGPVELVEDANKLNRGGVLRLGAVLTTTSAPLRTSPVKRGDWVLRRILGTPTPPPPPDAGTIPSDDKNFGGLSVRDRLAQHKRNATCATCHTRIDPLGFPLEHFDSTGRWRENYSDGKPIDDNGELANKSVIPGVKGLLDYLHTQQDKVQLTLSHKLLGYALGRTVQGSDQLLVNRMVAAGDKATIADLANLIVTSGQFRTIAPSTPLNRQSANATRPANAIPSRDREGAVAQPSPQSRTAVASATTPKTSDKVGTP